MENKKSTLRVWLQLKEKKGCFGQKQRLTHINKDFKIALRKNLRIKNLLLLKRIKSLRNF